MLVLLTEMFAFSYDTCDRTLPATFYGKKVKETEYVLSDGYPSSPTDPEGLTIKLPTYCEVRNCKLCSVWELTEQLDCKSMEIKWYKYMKGVDNKGVID